MIGYAIVVGAGGRISLPWESPAHVEQRRRLEREGVKFLANGRVDLARSQWKKTQRRLQTTR